jgi:hypothetical protein
VLVDPVLAWFLLSSPLSFEQLAALERFLLPTTGTMVLAVNLALLKPDNRGVGVTHPLERLDRLDRQQSYLSAKKIYPTVFHRHNCIDERSDWRPRRPIHLGAPVSNLLR